MDGLSPGLSAYFKQRIVWLLTESAFAPRTLLLATHDLALAESFANAQFSSLPTTVRPPMAQSE